MKRFWTKLIVGAALVALVAAPVVMVIDSGVRVKVSYRQTYTFVQFSPVIQAIIDGKSLDEIKQIVAKNSIVLKNVRESDMTPLHWVAGTGRVDLARYFLDSGVDINAQNSDASTALELAVNKRDKEMVKFLLERGADSTIPDKWGDTPGATRG